MSAPSALTCVRVFNFSWRQFQNPYERLQFADAEVQLTNWVFFGLPRPLICSAFIVSLTLASWGQAFQIKRISSLGGWPTFPMAVNNNGEVVGNSVTSAHQDRAFLWTRAAGTQDLGTISGMSSGRAINSKGQIAGVFG